MNLYSYVVAYDSGFAPNPFYGYCTLATCKPTIRANANVGDWIVGSGSADQKRKHGGLLVYSMKVSEILSFEEYFEDPRFQTKKPILNGSRKQVRGDNIYHRENDYWLQSNSYHSNANGTPNPNHVIRDTAIDRVLISNYFCYFGKEGPTLPILCGNDNRLLVHKGRGFSKFSNEFARDLVLIRDFVKWFKEIGRCGYISHPFDWSDTQ